MHRHQSVLERLAAVIDCYATWRMREVHRDITLARSFYSGT